jgi:hypothetical protein
MTKQAGHERYQSIGPVFVYVQFRRLFNFFFYRTLALYKAKNLLSGLTTLRGVRLNLLLKTEQQRAPFMDFLFIIQDVSEINTRNINKFINNIVMRNL